MNDAQATPNHTATFLSTAINILAAPREAFAALQQRPTRLAPLLLIVGSVMLTNLWYFNMVDYDWYLDDVLSQNASLDPDEMAQAREAMESISPTMMKGLGTAGAAIALCVIYVLQAGYLSLVAALRGDRYGFGHWFSLICWTSLPHLLSVLGMVVTIILSPNGQLSPYDLDPLTFANLGMQSGNDAVQSVLRSLNLTMVWSLALVVMAYRQWLETSLTRALGVVLAPYALIFGIWAYFALA